MGWFLRPSFIEIMPVTTVPKKMVRIFGLWDKHAVDDVARFPRKAVRAGIYPCQKGLRCLDLASVVAIYRLWKEKVSNLNKYVRHIPLQLWVRQVNPFLGLKQNQHYIEWSLITSDGYWESHLPKIFWFSLPIMSMQGMRLYHRHFIGNFAFVIFDLRWTFYQGLDTSRE